ncbi:MAG: nicotinamidase-related amidase [Halieaceae bacterium]|jgi:nicotinamidase-related amidase
MRPTFVDSFSQTVAVNAADTALLIIDMQNATGNRDMGLGKILAEQGTLEDAAYRFDRIDQVLIPNISKLADAFRSVGAKVVYITYGANMPDASDVPAHIAGIVKATNNIAGQAEHEIVAALAPKPDELVVNKTTQGAFRSTGIDSHLKAMGVKSVVCVGVSTNNCVAMTAMEACDAQYRVVMVSDGTGTDSDEMQTATLTMLKRLWSRVMTTDEVIAELGAT